MIDPQMAANKAASAVAALDSAPAIQSAEDMADAFERAGARIANSLERAAQSGQLSFSGMAESVLNDLARLAVSELIEAPLNALVDGLTGQLGQAISGGKGATMVNMTVNGAADAGSFARSQGQIAAGLARAVSMGQGRI